jgi:hypothetical protein
MPVRELLSPKRAACDRVHMIPRIQVTDHAVCARAGCRSFTFAS